MRQNRNIIRRVIMAACFTLAVQGISAQEKTDSLATDSLATMEDTSVSLNVDSIVKAKTPKATKDWSTWRPNPKRALWLALVIPGGGQIYNRKYWKLPIVYGGFMGCLYAMSWNNTMYKDYSQAYLDLVDNDPNTQSYNSFLHIGTTIKTDADKKRYEDLFKTCRRLNIPQAEINALFRQAVFNFLMNNTDDHKKNFSFVMDEKYQWHLSPAYDLTFIIDDYGIAPEKTHCMSLEGKFAEVSEQDLILFARKNDIKAPESIIKDVRAASMLFEKYARENGINGYCTEMISRRLNELGREKPMEVESIDLRIGDVDLSDIHFEMASKGNIHLCATVNGAKRKTLFILEQR